MIAGPIAVRILVRQQIERTKHEPTRAELARLERRPWERPRQRDETPTEMLTLELDGGQPYAGSRWRDGKRRQLESVLGEVVHEIGMRAVLSDRAHAAREHAAEERRREWQAAVGRRLVVRPLGGHAGHRDNRERSAPSPARWDAVLSRPAFGA